MKLIDLVRRPQPPSAWVEGDNIPWDDPGFSVRMLAEHLTQSHDAASRRLRRIDDQIGWIHETLLCCRSTRVLDLGCGPGLYTERLAALGHQCVGVDYSPASIAYAREQAAHKGLRCAYKEADIRQAEFGSGIGLAMMIYGEFNTLPPDTAAKVLQRVFAALLPGGILLLEPHTFEGVLAIAERGSAWSTASHGLFSDGPHALLEENHWDRTQSRLTTRFYVVDANSGEVTRFARTMQAYTEEGYEQIIQQAGFTQVAFHPALGPTPHPGLHAIVAHKS